MKIKYLFSVLGCAGMALATQTNAVTFTFQENGTGDKGVTSTFTEGIYSLTASGFTTAGVATDLYAKFTSGDPTETGLGIASDAQHEINTHSFVQLTLPTTPPTTFNTLITGSLQSGEIAHIYFTKTAGSLSGATDLGTATGGGTFTFTIGSLYQNGYIDITADSGNVLLDSASVTPSTRVPDSGTTVAMLGCALTALGFARRKMIA
jgi:hypothetical protein